LKNLISCSKARELKIWASWKENYVFKVMCIFACVYACLIVYTLL